MWTLQKKICTWRKKKLEPGWNGRIYGSSHTSGGTGLLPDHSNTPSTLNKPGN